MPPDEYKKALDKALSDLEERIQRRYLLNAEIAGLRETIRSLSGIVQIDQERRQRVAQLLAMADYATPNLTDAIRNLLTHVHPKEMTAIEVRNELEDSSDVDPSSTSLSACHAALKRLFGDGQVEHGPTRDGKATYRRVLKLEPPLGILDILSGRAFSNVAPVRAQGNETPSSRNAGTSMEGPDIAKVAAALKHTALPPPPPRTALLEDMLKGAAGRKKKP